jgi:cytochrome c biogenesis protein
MLARPVRFRAGATLKGRKTPVNAIIRFFRSVRLTVVLILFIILFALLSTLVEQGKPAEYYSQHYSPFVAGLITVSGLQNYTSSLLFIVSTGLFILNLGTCTIHRLLTRARTKAVRHFGPDLIHVGLLILAVGALITAGLRKEQDFTMGPGDAVNLPGGYTMSLASFDFQKYPDGRPKAWISTVDLTKDSKPFRKGVKIEVNHPLELGLLKVYQTSYATEGLINLVDAAGKSAGMKTGQGVNMGDSELWFAGTRPADDPAQGYVAQLENWKGQTFVSKLELAKGDKLGSFTVTDVLSRDVTGLRAASDPGFIPVLIALILVAIGLTMTSIHKSKGDL